MWWKKATKEVPGLEERLGSLERQIKDMRLEWELTHDKLVQLVARFNKRAERIVASERQAEAESDSPTGSTTVSSQRSHPDPMSARILARRQRFFPGQRSAGNSSEEVEK